MPFLFGKKLFEALGLKFVPTNFFLKKRKKYMDLCMLALELDTTLYKKIKFQHINANKIKFDANFILEYNMLD